MIGIIFLIFFVISAVLLSILVLMQDDQGDSMGSMFGGGSGSAFGGASSSVLVKITGFFGVLFIVLAIGTAFTFRSKIGDTGVEKAIEELNAEEQDNKENEELVAPEVIEDGMELILTIPEEK